MLTASGAGPERWGEPAWEGLGQPQPRPHCHLPCPGITRARECRSAPDSRACGGGRPRSQNHDKCWAGALCPASLSRPAERRGHSWGQTQGISQAFGAGPTAPQMQQPLIGRDLGTHLGSPFGAPASSSRTRGRRPPSGEACAVRLLAHARQLPTAPKGPAWGG